jgi:hypothetical protein
MRVKSSHRWHREPGPAPLFLDVTKGRNAAEFSEMIMSHPPRRCMCPTPPHPSERKGGYKVSCRRSASASAAGWGCGERGTLPPLSPCRLHISGAWCRFRFLLGPRSQRYNYNSSSKAHASLVFRFGPRFEHPPPPLCISSRFSPPCLAI